MNTRSRQPRSITTMREHAAKHLSHGKHGNNFKVKFSRAMWDRLLRDQNEYAALRKVIL